MGLTERTAAKIVLVGAGSQDFGIESISGLMRERQALRGTTVTLMDIDASALERMAAVARQAVQELDAEVVIETTTDRGEAVRGADFVIVSVEVDRMATWQRDWEIPLEHGFNHMLGENAGPGGLSHSLRTIPLVLDICRDVEALAPEALVINYTNPMSRICLAASRYTSVRLVGLCHQFNYVYTAVGYPLGAVTAPAGTDAAREQAREVASWLDVQACGINHLSFMTHARDRRTGKDVYPILRERLRECDPSFDPISRRLYDELGLLPIGGDLHVGEFIDAGGTASEGPPFAEWSAQSAEFAERLDDVARGRAPALSLLRLDRPPAFDERAISIIASIRHGRNAYENSVNIVNDGCIQGLPDSAVVEVPAVVGSFGVRGLAMGSLPAAATALLNQQIAVQDRVVEAAVHGDRAAALQALRLDPVTTGGGVASERMLDELLEAHAQYLPQFAAGPPVSAAAD